MIAKSDRSKVHLLFVISSLQIGGPQKSLLGLLQRLDPELMEVSLMMLSPDRSELLGDIPSWIGQVDTPREVTAATLPKGEALKSLKSLVHYLARRRNWGALCNLVQTLSLAVLLRRPPQQVRQRVWRAVGPSLPKVPGHYDLAAGILGSSTYALVDLVSAKKKFHWVRSDSRMLHRDEAIEDFYFARIHGALCVSPLCETIYVQMYPRMSNKTIVYKNDIPKLSSTSVRDPFAKFGSGVFRLVTVARLDPLKGLDLAIEACRELRERGVPVAWLVVGGGPERQRLEEAVARAGVQASFRFVGPDLDPSAYVRHADVYVHPSRYEGRSNSVEEARALGKAILATAYATVSDQIQHNIDGVVVDMAATAIADGLQSLLLDDGLRERLGKAAQTSYTLEMDEPNEVFSALVTGVLPKSDE